MRERSGNHFSWCGDGVNIQTLLGLRACVSNGSLDPLPTTPLRLVVLDYDAGEGWAHLFPGQPVDQRVQNALSVMLD